MLGYKLHSYFGMGVKHALPVERADIVLLSGVYYHMPWLHQSPLFCIKILWLARAGDGRRASIFICSIRRVAFTLSPTTRADSLIILNCAVVFTHRVYFARRSTRTRF